MEIKPDTLEWLLAGDPCVRWQVMRDLEDKEPAVYQKERNKIPEEGWGKRLLSHQNPAGTWGGGLYSPKWISTTYTLLALRRLGLPPETQEAHQSCEQLIEGGFYEPDGGINFSASYIYSETCITGMIFLSSHTIPIQMNGFTDWLNTYWSSKWQTGGGTADPIKEPLIVHSTQPSLPWKAYWHIKLHILITPVASRKSGPKPTNFSSSTNFTNLTEPGKLLKSR